MMTNDKAVLDKFDSSTAASVTVLYAEPPQVDYDNGVIRCVVQIKNDSSIDLSSIGDFPIRLSAFIVSPEQPQPYVGDLPRNPIAIDVKSGGVGLYNIALGLPQDIGSYIVAVTLLQENVMWFHMSNPSAIASHQFEYKGHPKWWSEEERDSVIYGDNDDLNQLRLKSLLACGTKKRPLMLHCETVNICNLLCVICPYNEMTRKKEVMEDDLFKKIISDYCDMGGGDVALTPSVGDVFLDKKIVDRIRYLKSLPLIKSIGFVTNAGNAGVFSDEDLSFVINSCARINISIYGLDEEETAAMTRRQDQYAKIIEQVKRIIRLNTSGVTIGLSFRLLKENAQQRADAWMLDNFGKKFPNGLLTSFGNWAGAIDTSKKLPFAGTWMSSTPGENTSACAYPIMHVKVAVNGDVKFCSCIDYDSHEENIIGNVNENSLLEIYNGQRAKDLWKDGLSICNGCTHAVPIPRLLANFELLRSPIRQLGV